MKPLNILMVICSVLLLVRLIAGHNGMQFYADNRAEVNSLKRDNDELIKRNELLAADVKDLKVGLEGIEERARNELGMIRQNETFFRLVPNTEEKR
ncbi:septum formation initiator family protein [Psychrosphaera aestuarii]|uniref:septum formation initiator family protein n=1 Tax=Psychrosphaera aestuarii TaxID=1266052 RepID=UPI001FD1FBED|nr:septum formation initiator family protein [Psychrosphaera aestuarii]